MSYLGTVGVAHLADRTLREGRLPAWWFYPLVALWANLHGQWFIAPTAITVAAGLHWLAAPRQRRRFAPRAAGSVGLTLLAGSLTPMWFSGILLPLQFRGAAGHISEWQVTELWSVTAIPLVLVVGLILISWARSPEPVPWWEICYVVVWTGFGLLAFRNAPVSALMLAPLAATRASGLHARDLPDDVGQGAKAAATGLRRRRAWRVRAFLASVLVATDPLERAEPLTIAQHMKQEGLGGRVLNAYNASGVLVAFGPTQIELAVDGRTERYGAEYIGDYLDVLSLVGSDWPDFLEEFEPEVAVVEQAAAIRHLLEDDWGWTVVMSDGEYVLLVPPLP